MKLIHKPSGYEIRVGDHVRNFRGELAIVEGWQKPTSPASTGRIYVDGGRGYYPSVFNCEWVEREDREES